MGVFQLVFFLRASECVNVDVPAGCRQLGGWICALELEVADIQVGEGGSIKPIYSKYICCVAECSHSRAIMAAVQQMSLLESPFLDAHFHFSLFIFRVLTFPELLRLLHCAGPFAGLLNHWSVS